MHSNDYDAHLGLALALRGQIDDSNYESRSRRSRRRSTPAGRSIRSDRTPSSTKASSRRNTKPRTREGTEKAIAVYQKAKQIFQAFLEKASANPSTTEREEDQGADAGH